MEVIGGSPKENRLKVKQWLKRIKESENPDTVILPELWTTSFMLKDLDRLADVEGYPTKDFLRNLAKSYKVNIVGGSIANKVNGKIYNTSYVFNKNGELVYEYSKVHLVPMLDEHLYLTGGDNEAKIFELDGIKMGLIICFDLRFPELARTLALQGAQVLYVVAQWPTPRKFHWTTLQEARAIENQVYLISSNNVGTVNDVKYAGSSMIVDPMGETIRQGSVNQEETITEDLDINEVVNVRESIPVFESRVPHLYNLN